MNLPLDISVDLHVVAVGNEHDSARTTRLGLTSTWLRYLQDFFARLDIYLKPQLSHARLEEYPELRDEFYAQRRTFPALYLLAVERLPGRYLGLWRGELGEVAQAHSLGQFTAVHEMGHALGLEHDPDTFMNASIELGLVRTVTPQQVAFMKETAYQYGRRA